MGLIITPQKEVNEYYEKELVNQSLLKGLLGGMDKFIDDKDKVTAYYQEKKHFVLGSAIDDILTGEEGLFEKLYYVSELEEKPSEIIISIVQMYYDTIKGEKTTDEEREEILFDCIKKHGWYENWKRETRVNKVREQGGKYLQELINSEGKQILSMKENAVVESVVESLKKNSSYSYLFNRELLQEDNNIEVYYQYPIYFEINDIDCKALLDFLIIKRNEEGKITEIKIIDLKTTSGFTSKFHNSFTSFRYDIQAAFYINAVVEKFNIKEEDSIKLDFVFLVESTTSPGKPLAYKISDEVILTGALGIPTITYNYSDDSIGEIPIKVKSSIKGFYDLLKEYDFYRKNGWKIDMEIEKNLNDSMEVGINWDGLVKLN